MRGTRSIIGGIAVAATAGAVVIAPIGILPIAHAATVTWTGGGSDTNWTTAANWDTPAVANDDLVFPGASGSATNDFAPGTVFSSLSIDGGTTLAGNRITLAGPIAAPTGTSTIALDITVAAARTITVGSGVELTVNGTIDGAGGITKAGAGTLVLAGTNTSTGATGVTGGTLEVSGSIASSSALTATNATVGGIGDLPATTISTGATLEPGMSAAGIVSTADLSLGAGSTLAIDLGGTTVGTQYDQVAVIGTVALAGTLSLGTSFTPAAGNTFTIIDNDGVDLVSGTFTGLAEGDTFFLTDTTYRVSYVGGTGNDVVITAVTPTATTLASSDLTTSFGESVTFTASVSPTAGSSGGSVEFREGAAVLGTGTVNGSGDATFTTSALSVGTHSIRAFYLGQGVSLASASNTISQVVGQTATSTTLAVSPNPSTFGDAVTLTATVTAAFGTPTGTVDFFDGATPLGSGTISAGEATLTTSSLSVGTHSITAVYAGTTNFATSSTSGPISVVVDPPATTTTVAATTTTVASTTTTVAPTTTVVDTTTTTTVAGATTTTVSGAGSGAGLPGTGSNALPGLLAAMVAALLGLGAVLTARRRTRA